jgi:NAD(P)-dependent dehydrogenase (short-subunit alcohol dehydrogenase family)
MPPCRVTPATHSLNDQVALVTGAASGIGRSSAQALAGLEAKLALADRNLPGVQAAAVALRECGQEAAAAAVEVADRDHAAAMVDSTLDTCGQLDILGHGTGIGVERLFPDATTRGMAPVDRRRSQRQPLRLPGRGPREGSGGLRSNQSPGTPWPPMAVS